jgi:aminoacyl-tRNA hydrolase
MVAERLVERWQLGRAKDRFRGRMAEGRIPEGSGGLGLSTSSGGLEGGLSGSGGLEGGLSGSGGPEGGLSGSGGLEGGLSGSGGLEGGAPKNMPAPRARVGRRVAVLCPQTYMNDAGRSVGPARGSFKLPIERVLVVHDEIDLPFGDVRTRLGGGLAGHNGLKSIKRELGSAGFMRVRVGVGRPKSTDPEIVSSYVLGRFGESPGEVGELIDRACEAVESAVLSEVQ